ncbi:MAG: hypothetical protein AAB430_02765 [Patescibacteria group bacterium]
MPYGEQAKHRDMQAMLEKLPSEFRIIPTDSIINSRIAQINASGLSYLTFWINGYDTNEAIANQLDVKTVTVKSVLYKTCQQVKNLNDDLADYFDTNIHLNPGLIAMKLIKGGFFKIVEPVEKA